MQIAGGGAGLDWAAENDGGLVRFRTIGDVSASRSAAIMGACSAYLRQAHAVGLVADYSSARLLLTADELAANLRRSAAEHRAIATPAALLVRPDDLARVLLYARRLSEIGVVRGVFTNAEDAHRWAARQAQIHAQEACRQIQASG